MSAWQVGDKVSIQRNRTWYKGYIRGLHFNELTSALEKVDVQVEYVGLDGITRQTLLTVPHSAPRRRDW